MAFFGAISLNGVDVTLPHGMDLDLCGEVDCSFVSPPIPPLPFNPLVDFSGVFVDGFSMMASGDAFGEHVRLGTDCDSLSGDCDLQLDHDITIPELSCSVTVFVNGMGAALPEIPFNCAYEYETEIAGGSVNVLIWV